MFDDINGLFLNEDCFVLSRIRNYKVVILIISFNVCFGGVVGVILFSNFLILLFLDFIG